MPHNALRRYTDLPSLISLLSARRLTLLSPDLWDDKNDSHYLRRYREIRDLRGLAALCFTQSAERYHHWRVFAPGASGVCIQFKRTRLLSAVSSQRGVTAREVSYRTLKSMRSRGPAVDDLPFVKRHAFKDEDEFRLVFESKVKSAETMELPIPLASIDRVVLSPWMHPSLRTHVVATLHSIRGCKEVKIVRSTLIANEEWKRFSSDAA